MGKMKLILYKDTREGFAGIGNWAVRKRTKSIYSHCEIMFEESDGMLVQDLMPDKSLTPNARGQVWCYGATASDRMPRWSDNRCRRAGKIGGTRFKRFVVAPGSWDIIELPFVDPLQVTKFCLEQEGKAYDWRHIFSFFSIVFVGFLINLFVNQGQDQWTCAEVIAGSFGFIKPEIYDPKSLGAVTLSILAIWNKAVGDPMG